MIVKHPSKRDWFRLDPEDAKPIYENEIPGLKIEGARFIAHRNLLTLLDDPLARKLLERPPSSSNMWARRDEVAAELGFKYRTTQQQALDFIAPRRGTLVGDDMRLGKTLTAVASHDPARGQLVVVAPLSTRGVWLGWMRRVFPSVPIGVFTGRTYDAEKARQPLVFAHYDIISSWQVIGRKIGTLVFDEAHLLGNPATKRSRAAALLSAWSEKVIALTGTPIWDLPPDLWSLLTMLCDGWGNRYDFCQRYGAPEPTAYGTVYTGLSNGAELKERLSEVMIRRRWIDVSEDVPPITRSVVIAEVSDKDRNKLDVLAGAIKSERTNTAANLAIYRQQVSLIKAKVVVDEARKVTGRGEPVVVWTWHKSTVDIIAKGLQAKDETVFVIHGDVAADKREQAMAEWKEHPNAVLIATMAVAQVGIDLSHARIAIFAEIDYTPAILGQAEMRTFSPTRGMDIIFVVANHLVDQRIVRALIAKLSAADPLGVGAAVDAIDALRDAVLGPQDEGDLDRLLEDLLASMA